MTTKELIRKVNFGESIAEQEANKLKDYFLKTEFWTALRNGSNDIIYGAKGAGKSALYNSLANDSEKLFFEDNILIAPGENPVGSTAFSSLTNDPPTTQTDFVRLWKLYFLVIAVSMLDDYKVKDDQSASIRKILVDCDLIPAQNKLSSFLKTCLDFIRSFKNGGEISTTAEFDPLSGIYSSQKFSIAFGEPTRADFRNGLVPIEHVYELLQASLKRNGIRLWIIIDRLDVAFLESEELETNALRALFKAYLDLSMYDEIKLKVFLRDDIWRRISDEGFREASHITKFQNLEWTKESLLNLLMRRVLDNPTIIEFYNLDKDAVLSDISLQEALFYRLFPEQIDVGSRKSKSMDWLLSRTKDGKGINTPRELIQLFSHARSIELKRQDNGINELVGDNILSRQSIKEAVGDVSRQRLEQTIYAEYPRLKPFIEGLRGDKAEHTLDTLAFKWGSTSEETSKIAKDLESIGFFEPRGDHRNIRYRIPFLYRPYLAIIQGSATLDD